MLTSNFDITSNFWKVNPQLTVFSKFKEFWEKDNSKNKEKSSAIMWGIASLLESVDENKLRNLPEDLKKNIIVKDIIKDKNFKWKDYEHLIEEYKTFNLTQADRELLDWNKYMEERSKILSNTALTISNIEDIDKIRLNTKKLFDDLKRIEDERSKNKTVSKTKGNAQNSASEEGLL